MFKVVYADDLVDALPKSAVLQNLVKFSGSDKGLGNYYAQPVVLSSEAGFTYNGEAGTVATLNDAVNGVTKEAQVKGTEVILKAQLSYTALSRAAQAGQRAFKKATSFKVEDMNNSIRKRLEISMLYGQVGVGTMGANVSGQVLTISDATWAGGIWAGAENHFIDVYQSNLSSVRQAGLQITAVDSDNKQLTVSGTVTGIVTGDVIFFKGTNSAGTFNEMAGLQKIITNTGTLFNISAATYSLWKGNAPASVGELTFAKIQDYVARAVNKGLMDDVICLVSPKAFAKLNSDAAALRVLDSSYKSGKAESGHEAVTFYGTNGKIDIVAHPYVKDGDSFIVPPKLLRRVGSTDVTFQIPGMGEDFFRLVSGQSAVELQCMCDQALFIEKPAHCLYLSGITFS
jgi:hypothetical protein